MQKKQGERAEHIGGVANYNRETFLYSPGEMNMYGPWVLGMGRVLLPGTVMGNGEIWYNVLPHFSS